MNLTVSIAEIAASRVRRAAKKQLRLLPFDGSFPAAPDQAPRLLYVHIPFCLTLCPYCSFHKFRFDEPSALRYFELLRRELRLLFALGYRFDSVYFGGGTTTVLPAELAQTIALIRELFGVREVSCESDPVHLARLSAPEFTAQIDRLSVGVQSFYDHYLKQIGRYAKFGSAAAQYKAVAQANGVFKTVNVDMIYNFPGQSEAELQEEIDTLLKLRPAQITFYPLMYSPATGAKLQKQWGALSSGREAKLSAVIREGLTGKYVQRSAWAWSLEKTGIIDEYVVEHPEYVGAGSGAFSFLGGRLYANTFSLPEYARLIDAGRTGATRTADFSSRSIAQYRAMVDLFGLKPPRSLWPETTLLKLVGAYDRTGVTPRGAYVASAMMREFYNGMDYIRQTMRQSLKPEDGLINS